MTADTRPAPSPYPGIGILIVSWLLFALAFALTSWIVPGMDISGGFWGYLWVSALFGLVNAIVGTILRILTFPLIIVTFGLFLILVNALLLALTDWLTSHLTIDEFWWTAIWAAIVLGLVTLVLQLVVQVFFGRDPRL
jgi:putative membrane protein